MQPPQTSQNNDFAVTFKVASLEVCAAWRFSVDVWVHKFSFVGDREKLQIAILVEIALEKLQI
jgi:hypothetical protein